MKQALDDLRNYILTDDTEPTFRSKYTGNDFEGAVETFVGMIEEDIELGAQYLMDFPDMGCSWLETYCFDDKCYWNIDDIWCYWVQLNKDKMLEV